MQCTRCSIRLQRAGYERYERLAGKAPHCRLFYVETCQRTNFLFVTAER